MAASYKIETTQDGTIYARTTVSWDRTFGKCNRQTFSKQGEIYTRSRLKAWGKKYRIDVSSDLEKLPTEVWWQQ